MRSDLAETVDDYISSQPAAIEKRLQALRAAVRRAAPEAEESISYRIPAYKLQGALVYFAAFEDHIGMYPITAGVKEALADELGPYLAPRAKSSAHFRHDRPLPLRLIARMEGSWVTTARRPSTGAVVSSAPAVIAASSMAAPITAARAAAVSTRRAPRFMVRNPLDVVVENGSASLIDISVLGAQVVSGPALRPNQKIKIALPDTRDLLSFSLRNYGAEVTALGSASEALAAIQRDKPDVLVSDIGLPGDDGYSLIRKVRALDEDRGGRVPAAALTAFARSEDRTRALRSGFQIHLAKPIDPNELMAAIASLARRDPVKN